MPSGAKPQSRKSADAKAEETKPAPEPEVAFVKYTGPAAVRSFTQSDFLLNGVEDQGDLEFNRENRWCSTVSPAAATMLVEMGEVVSISEQEMKEQQAPEEPMQMVASMGEVIPGQKEQ